jgi:hypothetical protein
MKHIHTFENFVNEGNINEGRAPKSWDTMFAMNVIKAYKDKKINPDDPQSIAAWDKDYNGGNVPRPPFETEAIIRYYIETGKGPDGKP